MEIPAAKGNTRDRQKGSFNILGIQNVCAGAEYPGKTKENLTALTRLRSQHVRVDFNRITLGNQRSLSHICGYRNLRPRAEGQPLSLLLKTCCCCQHQCLSRTG